MEKSPMSNKKKVKVAIPLQESMDKSGGVSLPKDRRRESEDRKRQFRMNQLAARGRGESNEPLQKIPSGGLPEDLSPQHEPGADQLMRKLRNRQQRSGVSDKGRPRKHGVSGLNNHGRNSGKLPGGQYGGGRDTLGSSHSLNVPQEEEGDTQQELDDQRDESRQQHKGEGSGSRYNTGSGYRPTQQTTQLIQQQRINEQRKKTEKLKSNISAIKRKIPVLILVLLIAVLKDVLDIVAEALSIGIWSWFDWLIDIPLGLAAFFLQIERKGTDRLIGWGIMSLEIIPYIDLLPAWTARVIFAVVKRLKEVRDLSVQMKKEQKKLTKLQSDAR